MKELEGQNLKDNIRANLIKAINNSNASAHEITIKFICDKNYQPKEKISIFGGITFRNVDLSILTKEQAIKVIIDNMHYDHFAIISNETKHGQVECHGHGDFWATDETSIIYARIK